MLTNDSLQILITFIIDKLLESSISAIENKLWHVKQCCFHFNVRFRSYLFLYGGFLISGFIVYALLKKNVITLEAVKILPRMLDQ